MQASTLGSLEALLEFLKTSKIPVKFIINWPIVHAHYIIMVSMVTVVCWSQHWTCPSQRRNEGLSHA